MSDLQTRKDDVKSPNYDFWTVPGNYAGVFGLVFFYVTVFQVVASKSLITTFAPSVI